MVDHQGRLGAVNLDPFVGMDLNLWPTVYIAVIVLADVKWIKSKSDDVYSSILDAATVFVTSQSINLDAVTVFVNSPSNDLDAVILYLFIHQVLI